ncbi:MAG: FMN-binding protein [Lachnospiraceae bacterium]|nr:FMN-binding protein [Lachnospiraceae bacterium]
MGIIVGYLCLICFVFLVVRAVTARCHLQKMDKFLRKCHKPLSVVMLILCALHIVLVIPVLHSRSLLVNVSGIVCIVCLLLLIILCHAIKEPKRKMWWHRLFAVITSFIIVVHMVNYFIDFMNYQQKIDSIEVSNIHIADMGDGTYEGEYDAGYIYAKVEVEVQGNKIVSVQLIEHRNERGEAAETIPGIVVEQQKTVVDAVSGATNSSKVIMKAIENALSN